MNYLNKEEVLKVLTEDSGAYIRVSELEAGEVTRYVFTSSDHCTIGAVTKEVFEALPLYCAHRTNYADQLNSFLRMLGGNSFDEKDYKLKK